MGDLVHCHLCGYPVSLDVARIHPLGLQWDHVVPRSLGGADDPSNLLPSHAWCNVSKGAAMMRSSDCTQPLDLRAALTVVHVFRDMPIQPDTVQIDAAALRELHPEERDLELDEALDTACEEIVDLVAAEYPDPVAALWEIGLMESLYERLRERMYDPAAELIRDACRA